MSDSDIVWRKIEKDIDLYKFYLELILKSGIFVLGITGGLVSFYFANQGKDLIIYSLLMPTLMNLGFFVICFKSIRFANVMRKEHFKFCKKVGIEKGYNFRPLAEFLQLFSCIYGVTWVALLIYLLYVKSHNHCV